MSITAIINPETGRILSITQTSAQIGPNTVEVTDENIAASIMTFFAVPTFGGAFLEQDLFFNEGRTQVFKKPNIAAIKRNKIKQFYNICDSKCNGGFESNVTGTNYVYPTRLIDQQNVHASVTASLNPTLPDDWTVVVWCGRLGDEASWALRPHTKSQVQALGEAYLRFIETQRVRLRDLVNIVGAMPDLATDENAQAIRTLLWD